MSLTSCFDIHFYNGLAEDGSAYSEAEIKLDTTFILNDQIESSVAKMEGLLREEGYSYIKTLANSNTYITTGSKTGFFDANAWYQCKRHFFFSHNCEFKHAQRTEGDDKTRSMIMLMTNPPKITITLVLPMDAEILQANHYHYEITNQRQYLHWQYRIDAEQDVVATNVSLVFKR